MRPLRCVVRVLVLVAALAHDATAQPARPTELQLLAAEVGPGGVVRDGRFVLSEQRGVFSRTDDRELVVTFQWEGSPGLHRMLATWRGPDGTVIPSSPVEYEAQDRRFGGYWRFSLSPTMALGTWVVDVTVDGQPGGRVTFEVTGEPVVTVPTKKLLTQAQLFERLNGVHVLLQRMTSAGRVLDPSAALLRGSGRLYTASSTIDETDRVHVYAAEREGSPITSLLAWSRSERWAVLESSVPPPAVELPLADHGATQVGDRCFALDGSPAGARVLIEGTISGRTTGEHPSWIVAFHNGLARPGSPVVNESGELLGLVDSPTRLYESLRARDELRGTRLVSLDQIRVPDDAAAISLEELRARGELMVPILGEAHVLSGGFAAAISRGPIVAPTDQRTEFSTGEKAFTVFVTWNPQERLRGMMSIKLFTADNRFLWQTKPKKSDLKRQELVLASWQVPMLTTPGVYRADVLMDEKVMWRGYVRLIP